MTFTVVIPARHAARTLPECLKSLSASTLRPAEVIVVVDGPSPDGTEEIARGSGARVLVLPERLGPGGARNAGVAAATGDVIAFVDADVSVNSRALGLLVRALEENPDVGAAFGSYDNLPPGTNLASQYKNLLHHFVHQSAREEAQTFWAGLGVVRRDVFERVRGFDAERYRRPSIEDVELGHRILASGARILLVKSAQGAHLKRWDVARAFRTDVLDRAMPWTELILETGQLPDDLNLGRRHRLGVASTGLLFAALIGVAFSSLWWWAVGAALLLALGAGSDVLGYLARERGLFFAVRAAPLHIAYFFASGLGFALGVVRRGGPRAGPDPESSGSSRRPASLLERRRVLAAALSVGIGELLLHALGFVALVWLCRVLGPQAFGRLELALMLATYGGALATFGLESVGMERTAKDPGSVRALVRAIVSLRLVLAAAAVAALTRLAATVPRFQADRELVFYASLGILVQAVSLAWVFVGMERTRYVTTAAVLGQVAYLVGLAVSVHGPEDLRLVPLLSAGGAAVTVAALAVLRVRNVGPLAAPPRLRLSTLVREAVPHAARAVGALLAGTSSLLILALVMGNGAIGSFQAGMRLAGGVATLGAAFTLAAFPSIARHVGRNERLRRAVDWAVVTSTAGWITILVVLVPTARLVVVMVLGPGFENAVVPFRLLLVALAIAGVRAQYQSALGALDRPDLALAPIWATAFTSVALGLALIPPFGLRGAGIAAIASELMRLVLTRYELVTVLAADPKGDAPPGSRG